MAQYTYSFKKDFVRKRITSYAKRCTCSTSNGEGYTRGYSLHAFPRDESMGIKGVKRERNE